MGKTRKTKVVAKKQSSTDKKPIATRNAYGEALFELGQRKKDIVVLDADLSGSTKTKTFAKAFPDRFYNVGVSEQDLIGTASGFPTTLRRIPPIFPNRPQ